MMYRAWIIAFVSCFLFLLLGSLGAAPAVAQRPTPTTIPTQEPTAVATPSASTDSNDGSIRGTVYEDQDGNGVCGAEDPTVSDIPLQFVSNDGNTALYLKSGADGTYGLVAAGYGTWQVSADPPAPWRVTSANPRQLFLSTSDRTALNINFCLRSGTTTEVADGVVLLPTAGASATTSAVPFLVAGLLGVFFIAAGLGLKLKGRPIGN